VPIVEVRKLTKVYGSGDTAVTALDHVDLSVDSGEFVAIMGPSGCGKSTMLNLIGGLDRPTEGTVDIDGVDIATMSDNKLTELRRRKIGFVFQFFNLIPVLNAIENTALPLMLDGANLADARQKAAGWLDKIGLENRHSHRPDQLSGGQQQRVAIARALVTEPAMILADEPTGNLDTRSSSEIVALLRQVSQEWGRSVIMVTHDPGIAAYADRIIFLKDGRVVDETRLNPSRPAGQKTIAAAL
jgi:putative ABC transport system ATP-binding protein